MELDIDKITDELIEGVKTINSNNHLNERYLHHLFSHIIQRDGIKISLQDNVGLHPEWATFVTGMQSRRNGLYRKKGYKYEAVKENGSSGYIDFAIGDVNHPEYAIEFKMSDSFDEEGVVFDYMKLLDSRNPINHSISIVVYYGRKNHSKKCTGGVLSECYATANKLLDAINCFADKRPYRFILLEVSGGSIISHIESVKNGIFENKST